MREREGIELGDVVERLRVRRAELNRLSKASVDARRPVEADQSRVGRLSRVEALQDQAMARATEQRRAEELRRIEAAFRRIEAGDYGYCVHCGEAIALARLEVDPTTPLCIACAERGSRRQ